METTLTDRRKLKRSFSLKPQVTQGTSPEDKLEKSGLCLKRYRIEKRIRQVALIRKLALDKHKVIRLESKPLGKVTLEELILFSEGAGIPIEDMISELRSSKKEIFERSSFKEPFFIYKSQGEGVRFGSFAKNPDSYFIGTLALRPRESYFFNESRRSELMCFSILEGAFHMKFAGHEIVLKEKECCLIHERLTCELFNPDYSKPLLAYVVTSPSFISVNT